MRATILEEYLKDEEFRRLFAQEDLILEVTETLCKLLEKEKISRKELADRLGKTKGFISQLLNGGRNLTLRTVADILHVLGYRASLKAYKEARQGQRDNIIGCQTEYVVKLDDIYHYGKEIEFSPADNYHLAKAAIFG